MIGVDVARARLVAWIDKAVVQNRPWQREIGKA